MVRLDKWLFAARFYKSRALAREMIDGGKIHYNQHRVKPSKIIELGALITLRQGLEIKEVKVIGLSEIRGSASQAMQLYEETPSSIEKRAKMALERQLNPFVPSKDKPNKKARRQIIQFKNRHGELS